MKLLISIFFASFFFMVGCSGNSEKFTGGRHSAARLKIPDTLVEKSALKYDFQASTWTLEDSTYSGYVISYYRDRSLKELFGILNGKKQNKYVQWFPDGHLKNVSDYHLGKLHGKKKLWVEDSLHMMIADLNYHQGKAHGEQTKWYPTGELLLKLNLNMGKEEGLQQAFRKNGVIYANYEAREGRIFGLKSASLCYGLESEQMRFPEKE